MHNVRTTPLVCRKCRNTSTAEYYLVCEECYAKISPKRIYDSAWVRILNPTEKEKMSVKSKDENLTRLILNSFMRREIFPDQRRLLVSVGGKLEVPVNEKSLDELATKSGLLIGKWLIYQQKEAIDKSWYAIASSILKGELGVDAKVSTAGKIGTSDQYVVDVYTKNYLDADDVTRVRQRLRELRYIQRLYYKPDLYTYLNIYKKTFPNFRASRYAA